MNGRIFIMLKNLFDSRKTILFISAGVIVFVLLAVVWRIVSLQKAASKVDVEPVLKIGYCGAEPEELCVLSFGRDVDENMFVSIFVPDRKFPDFNVRVKRIAGESVYECERNKEVPTNVFCYGDMVNLQEKMEVSLIATSDERLIAAGDFILKALLISDLALDKKSDGTSTSEPIVNETPTTPEFFGAPVATPVRIPTKTPDASYPNPQYP